ncbi:protein kinase family protein [Hespellia stercorisuis]|uniref:Spore coat protein, CotS family n=1 Tax=Hespellia stercorisuis DSM 15480 TaxID=1121950 RepID=A0A1M6QHE9_9FIRM|nr:hypothetical protein [Hespellia stercorisuis]SHK19608.1 spore coat protein, CotS family [Hespellia stercorisuis DSM 15480]
MRDYELDVLEQYPIEIMSTRKIRGAYFCETNEGIMALSAAPFAEKRAALVHTLCSGLEERGYERVDTLLANKEGKFVSERRDGSRYILKKWYQGAECDVKNERDVLGAAKNLARLHLLMTGDIMRREPVVCAGKSAETGGENCAERCTENGTGNGGGKSAGMCGENCAERCTGTGAGCGSAGMESARTGETAMEMVSECREQPEDAVQEEESLSGLLGNARNLTEEYRRHNMELKKVRRFVRNRSTKSAFETEFLACFDEMFEVAQNTQDRLAISDFEHLYEMSMQEQTLIHGDYNYHNVLMAPGGIATTNFHHFRMDVQVADLYYFLRKVMEKYRWRSGLGSRILDMYAGICPLTEEELEYIAIRLTYPEKFWKIVNAYYLSNKAMVSVKNREKLRAATAETTERLRFVKTVFLG